MRIEELDYELPIERIADRPVEPREACRLLVAHRSGGAVEHRRFLDLLDYLNPADLLVLNSARVVPARLYARKTDGGKSGHEILVLDAGLSHSCRALIYPARKINPGMELITSETGRRIRVMDRLPGGQWQIEIDEAEGGWRKFLEQEGHMPLPPYILKRRAQPMEMAEDRVWYQTAYADRDGAIAAPTAGLHFSQGMLQQIRAKGVKIAHIFLSVGLGTFQPIRAKIVEEHVLVPEEYEVGEEAAQKIRETQECGGRIIAVGTTVVRTLEFCAQQEGGIRAGSGTTGLLITPEHRFRAVGGLITNFHLPKTTLLALVIAFGGSDLIHRAYVEAIRGPYRFFSYGDAMLIV